MNEYYSELAYSHLLCKHNYDISIYMVSLLISPPGVKNILFRGSAHLGHGAHKIRTGIVDKEKDSFCSDCTSLPAKRWWHALHQTPTAQPDVGFRWQTDAVWFPRKERREMKWGCVWGGGQEGREEEQICNVYCGGELPPLKTHLYKSIAGYG